MSTITVETHLVTQACVSCGMLFAVAEDYDRRRREDHQQFYCPAGHSQVYSGKSEAERLREQLAAKEREVLAAKSRIEAEQQRTANARSERDAVTRSLRATRAVVTRTKKKIVAGRCPCCSHQFKNLRDHMAKEHPKYDPDKAAAAIESKVTP
jgi:chromosome segregation ATPase